MWAVGLSPTPLVGVPCIRLQGLAILTTVQADALPGDTGLEPDWISWDAAARIVGCSPRTLEYHVAAGRVRRRPAIGSRPVIDAESARAFAAHRAEQWAAQAARQSRRPRTRRSEVPEGWLTSAEAAALLGLGTDRVVQLGREGDLPRRKHGRGYLYPANAVATMAEQRQGWVSAARAAEMTGRTLSMLRRAAERGEIITRKAPRATPALSTESVLAWAEQHPKRERKPKPRAASAAPDDGLVWLPRSTVALMLGISTTRVAQLTAADRIPHQRRGHRTWYRRDHIEQLAAARAVHRAQERSHTV